MAEINSQELHYFTFKIYFKCHNNYILFPSQYAQMKCFYFKNSPVNYQQVRRLCNSWKIIGFLCYRGWDSRFKLIRRISYDICYLKINVLYIKVVEFNYCCYAEEVCRSSFLVKSPWGLGAAGKPLSPGAWGRASGPKFH